jgi:hypothetical protein
MEWDYESYSVVFSLRGGEIVFIRVLGSVESFVDDIFWVVAVFQEATEIL